MHNEAPSLSNKYDNGEVTRVQQDFLLTFFFHLSEVIFLSFLGQKKEVAHFLCAEKDQKKIFRTKLTTLRLTEMEQEKRPNKPKQKTDPQS